MKIEFDFRADMTVCELVQYLCDELQKEARHTDEIINNYPNRTETIEKKVNYILNNYNQIKDMLEANIGSSMEAHISHCVANQFGSRPKEYFSSRIIPQEL